MAWRTKISVLQDQGDQVRQFNAIWAIFQKLGCFYSFGLFIVGLLWGKVGRFVRLLALLSTLFSPKTGYAGAAAATQLQASALS